MCATPVRDFWTWSLDRYAGERVATTLIDLQDRFSLNVNLVLWCCWCAEGYEPVPDAAMVKAHEAVSTWSSAVTGPLRGARRFLKTSQAAAAAPEASLLRIEIKRLELDSEKIEQILLTSIAENDLTASPGADETSRRKRAGDNLRSYAKLAGADGRDGFSDMKLDAAAAVIFAAPLQNTSVDAARDVAPAAPLQGDD
ncbi:MAG: TIGR02444 family protein [Pseudomonadota bacterium]